ncbi:MAG: hypothetical protein ACO1OQ_09450 [Rufibacter sp.]
MDFKPPIATRSTQELIEIAHFTEKWQPEASAQARVELQKRGVTEQKQQRQVERWQKGHEKHLRKMLEKRAIAGYDILQILSMLVNLPSTIFSDWHLKEDGYLRKHRQRLWIIASGISFWGLLALSVVYLPPTAEDEKWLKEIEATDISEWEKSYYGEVKPDTTNQKNTK